MIVGVFKVEEVLRMVMVLVVVTVGVVMATGVDLVTGVAGVIVIIGTSGFRKTVESTFTSIGKFVRSINGFFTPLSAPGAMLLLSLSLLIITSLFCLLLDPRTRSVLVILSRLDLCFLYGFETL